MSEYLVRETALPYQDRTEQVNSLFRKVYQWMALGLILTAVMAYVVASSRTMLGMLYGSGAGVAIVAIVEVGLVLWLSARIQRLSVATAATLFLVYSVLNGVLCSAVLLVYTQGSVYNAFLSTAGMFAVMSVWGLYTQRDMTSFGSFLRMGLWGLIIAMLVNLFMGSSMMDIYISVFAILIFLGMTAWDTWKIRQIAHDMEDGADGEWGRKVAIMGALALYLDFINLFLHLLRLFGKRR
ncbi:MAG: Bax inhibitor-1/YccA family protein [Synergistaceae bacterium]|nr:Bax inhibitor-1/YccA family protein [Synergistaceae bacterium]